MKTVATRAVITEEIPLRLAELRVPPDWRLADWLQHEHDRIKRMYPQIKVPVETVSLELCDMLRVADRLAAEWEEKRQLVRVVIREELGFAKRAITPDGKPLAERRMYDVDGYSVREHKVDAIFRL